MDFSGLDPVERLRFTLILRASFAWYEDIFNQARRGGVDSEYWVGHQRTSLTSFLKVPGIREWWQSDQSFFTDAFRNEINRQLAAQQGDEADRP